MQTHTAEDGTFVMEWYAPSAVTALNDGDYQTSGSPYKTSAYKVTWENGVKTVTMTRQQGELPPYTITRIEQGNLVTIIKGTGDETIIRTIETNQLYGNMSEIIESVRGINDVTPVSCTRELKQNVNGTWLLISRTEAFNTEIAQTTTYEYNADLRIEKVTYHNGNYVEYEYDSMGRVTKETRPWSDGGKQMTRNVYAANSSRFYDNRPIKVYTDYEDASGKFLNIAVTDYTYEDSAEVERTTATTYAAGVNHQQVTIDETYGEASAYAYAAGKPKFSQAINGVQTWYDYEATTEHDATHKHTVTTKANGELVAAHSRKAETFIAADDTTTFEQEFIWDGENWLLLNTTAFKYDEEKRVIKTTRGNGRFSTTEWMCCGKLSETNEDGITTSYGYNSAHQLVETIRTEVKDGDVVITPETITSYTYDAAGRTLSVRRDIGAMTTTESTEYDLFGRVIKQIDVLGRETATDYSADGLTTTVTTPAGATFVTTSNTDGSTQSISGTGQRAQQYSYDINGKNIATTVRLMNNAILSQNIVNGFGQMVVQTSPATNNRFIYTRSEYNSKGQMVKQYQDTGWNTTSTAPTLYEYDTFGNVVKQIIALSDTPTKDNSPVVEMAHSIESIDDGIYSVITLTRYNAEGTALNTTQKQLISELSVILASKSISTDVRGNISVNWSEYTAASKVTSFNTIPTSDITADSISIDGFTISQKNHVGISTTASRSYTATGMTMVQVDGRGNASTISTDLAGHSISMKDASGAITSTIYDFVHNQPSIVTDALGNTSCYKYDLRGRKIAEWGTALQPACFGYDEADNLISLKTFRAGTEIISSDPSKRIDGDETTWAFDPATGLELSKTYADNGSVVKTYDSFNRLSTETDARNIVKNHSYETARGLLLGTTYSDTTTARSYTYNHLGQLTQVTDDAGIRSIGYNAYGEQETDSLLADEVTHLITETRDAMGRSTGFTYTKNGEVQHTDTTGYGADGRIATAGFLHGGIEKQFGYSYLPGSNLLQTLTMPCNMTLTQSYETRRDLLIGMAYHRGSTLVTQRTYTYDTLGRPLTRSTARNGQTMNDSFVHNSRSELARATVNGATYGYDYDNIGNRRMAIEASDYTIYEANELNQYTSIQENEDAAYVPSFDADGNQTMVKTATGIWTVKYNAENRPIFFTSVDDTTVIECSYDFMGRRATKKVTIDGSITLHQRYIYRGYLQIACCDLTRSVHPCLWLISWDPTQSIASRPLAIRKDGTWYAYGWDIIKNIWEIFGPAGYIRKVYTYSPFGTISSEGDIEQSIQWSSEYYDAELGLIYYNYRHYNPTNGKWCSRDALLEKNELNLYNAFTNAVSFRFDILGLQWKQNKDTPHYYTASSHADTLQDLAKIAGGSGNDWVCLWPVKVKEKKGYPRVRECDTYDISNLNHSGISAEYLLSIDLIGNYNHIYPNIIFLDPMKVSAELARKTKEGESPFSSLVLAGHGGYTGKFKYPIPVYWDNNNLNDYRAFFLETLKALDKAPSYERAKQKKGPVRCWFTKNANVVFSGCESKMIAEPFAAAFLRKTAKAKGTKKTIGTGLYSGKPTMFSDPVMDENGNVINWDTKSDYWNSPLWVEYSGSLV